MLSKINKILNHENDLINKDIFKNCKGKIVLGNYEYIVEELLKRFKFNKHNKNEYFLNLLKSLSVINLKNYKENISCDNDDIDVLICNTNIENTVIIKKIYDDKDEDFIMLEKKNINNYFFCKMKNTQNFDIKISDKDQYNTNYEELNRTIITIMEKSPNPFIYRDDNYIISCSNHDLFDTLLLENWNNLSKNIKESQVSLEEKLELIYDFLSDLKFYYIPKYNDPNHILKAFNKYNIDDLKMFKIIKTNIERFIINIFSTCLSSKKGCLLVV